MIGSNASSAGEVTELLQTLIRNRCVNDGSPESGHEMRSTDTLTSYLGTAGFDSQIFEPSPGRRSLVTRMEGTRKDAPSLLLLGHTDVVPVSPERWRHDPFGGELIDGTVWGRGAVDMLNLTASMAVAFKRLADSGFRPEGDLVYIAVADEEALGTLGAQYLVDEAWESVSADYVITESGGIPIPSPSGIKLPIIVGEKGAHWVRLRIVGAPGHGSQPYRTDNALVKAAEVVRRIAAYEPGAQIHDVWRRFISSMGYPEEVTGPLLGIDSIDGMLETLPDAMARQFHACTHTTMAPTVLHGGSKINTIPDMVELDVDIRTLPGQTADEAEEGLALACGDLWADVELEVLMDDESTASPIDTPLWDTLSRQTQRWYPGSETVPYLTVGATDGRFFRHRGATAYGFGLFTTAMTFEDYGIMFHGDNERVDVESLVLSTDLWEATARDLLS